MQKVHRDIRSTDVAKCLFQRPKRSHWNLSSVVTLATFISLPVSIPLSSVSLAGAGISGITTALTK